MFNILQLKVKCGVVKVRKTLLIAITFLALILIAMAFILIVYSPFKATIISFEEAVNIVRKPKEVGSVFRWVNFKEYRYVSEYRGKVFKLENIRGYFLWHSSNGYLYEAEYPSGKVYLDRAIEYIKVEDTLEYYVWKIHVLDEAIYYIDAHTGEILLVLPAKIPSP